MRPKFHIFARHLVTILLFFPMLQSSCSYRADFYRYGEFERAVPPKMRAEFEELMARHGLSLVYKAYNEKFEGGGNTVVLPGPFGNATLEIGSPNRRDSQHLLREFSELLRKWGFPSRPILVSRRTPLQLE